MAQGWVGLDLDTYQYRFTKEIQLPPLFVPENLSRIKTLADLKTFVEKTKPVLKEDCRWVWNKLSKSGNGSIFQPGHKCWIAVELPHFS